MAKRKEITCTVHINYKGTNYKWDELTDNEKKLIGFQLNDRAMKSIGYKPINEEEYDNILDELKRNAGDRIMQYNKY